MRRRSFIQLVTAATAGAAVGNKVVQPDPVQPDAIELPPDIGPLVPRALTKGDLVMFEDGRGKRIHGKVTKAGKVGRDQFQSIEFSGVGGSGSVRVQIGSGKDTRLPVDSYKIKRGRR